MDNIPIEQLREEARLNSLLFQTDALKGSEIIACWDFLWANPDSDRNGAYRMQLVEYLPNTAIDKYIESDQWEETKALLQLAMIERLEMSDLDE